MAAHSWRECGYVDADGEISLTNTGTHDVTVFNTGREGIDRDASPGVGPICQTGGYGGKEVLECLYNLPPRTRWGMKVYQGDVVYIARADGMWSDRTIAVQFDEVPGS